jgi:hypothetical protein
LEEPASLSRPHSGRLGLPSRRVGRLAEYNNAYPVNDRASWDIRSGHGLVGLMTQNTDLSLSRTIPDLWHPAQENRHLFEQSDYFVRVRTFLSPGTWRRRQWSTPLASGAAII